MAYLNWSIPVSSLINKLQKAGFSILAVEDEGGEYTKLDQNKSKLAIRKEVVEAIVSVDVSWVRVQKGDQKGTLFIVLGNDPYEIVCDYTDWNDLEKVVTEYSTLWDGKNCPMVA